jgi:hypothetical protein
MNRNPVLCVVAAALLSGSCSTTKTAARINEIAWEAEGYAIHRGKVARLEKVVVNTKRVSDGVELVVATTGGVAVLDTARGPLNIPLSEGDRLLLGEAGDFVLVDKSVGAKPGPKPQPPPAPRR